MTETGFQRARSAQATQQREAAILDAARQLGAARGIREVTLTDIAKLLKNNPQLHIRVVGHTDNQGKPDYNLDLSRRRAGTVAGVHDDRERIEAGDNVLLIVEDDPTFARILCDLAHDRGMKVLIALRGDRGLQIEARRPDCNEHRFVGFGQARP